MNRIELLHTDDTIENVIKNMKKINKTRSMWSRNKLSYY